MSELHPTTSKEPHIRLHHLLMLGSPNGKNELIQGRVHRCIRVGSATRARELFEGLAREIAELQGLGSRPDLVDGSDRLEVGPFVLTVDDGMVWLTTEIPRDVWYAFS